MMIRERSWVKSGAILLHLKAEPAFRLATSRRSRGELSSSAAESSAVNSREAERLASLMEFELADFTVDRLKHDLDVGSIVDELGIALACQRKSRLSSRPRPKDVAAMGDIEVERETVRFVVAHQGVKALSTDHDFLNR